MFEVHAGMKRKHVLHAVYMAQSVDAKQFILKCVNRFCVSYLLEPQTGSSSIIITHKHVIDAILVEILIHTYPRTYINT